MAPATNTLDGVLALGSIAKAFDEPGAAASALTDTRPAAAVCTKSRRPKSGWFWCEDSIINTRVRRRLRMVGESASVFRSARNRSAMTALVMASSAESQEVRMSQMCRSFFLRPVLETSVENRNYSTIGTLFGENMNKIKQEREE